MVGSGWFGWNWGDVPSWVGALLTGTSLLIAALAYRGHVKEGERQQAGKVGAWVQLTEDGTTSPGRQLRVSNNSDGPISDLTVRVGGKEYRFNEVLPHSIVPSDLPPRPPSANVKETTVGVKMWFVAVEGTIREETVSEEPIELEFRDSVGRFWLRNSNGRLKRLYGRTIRHVSLRTVLDPPGAVIAEVRSKREDPPAH